MANHLQAQPRKLQREDKEEIIDVTYPTLGLAVAVFILALCGQSHQHQVGV
jgi:hypothetical protein